MVALAFAVLPYPASAAGVHVVLDATPTTKVQATETEAERFVLTKSERPKFMVTIVRRGDRFFWSSRESLELLHQGSGAGHFFVAPQGGGYVKVFDTHYLPPSMRSPGPRFTYMEHLTLPGTLGSITYFGATDEFDLGGDLSDGAK